MHKLLYILLSIFLTTSMPLVAYGEDTKPPPQTDEEPECD